MRQPVKALLYRKKNLGKFKSFSKILRDRRY
jgi:hypothetical protein